MKTLITLALLVLVGCGRPTAAPVPQPVPSEQLDDPGPYEGTPTVQAGAIPDGGQALWLGNVTLPNRLERFQRRGLDAVGLPQGVR